MKEGLTVIFVGGAIAIAILFWLTRGTEKQRGKKAIAFLTTVFGGIFLLSFAMCAFPNKEIEYTPTTPTINTDDQQVRFAVKRAVEGVLKAPSTAKFQNPNDFLVKKLAANVWEVSGHVDAQNGFGAMIRNHFRITLSKAPNGEWKPLDADIR